MASPLAQYTRRHRVTVPLANWGAAFSHTHNLGDGLGGGYTPNMVKVNKVWVTVNGTEYAIEAGCVVATAPTATNLNIFVGDTAPGTAFRDALTTKFGSPPTNVIVEVEVRFVHSVEMGQTATADETIGLPVAGRLPVSLYSGPTPSGGMETIYVRTTGNDANDGRTVGTAYLTMQRAWNDLERPGRVYHDIMIDCGVGTFAGNVAVEGIQFSGGARFFWMGAVPTVALKTSTSAGAATIAASGRDSQIWRLSPDAAWDVAPAAADVRRTLRIRHPDGRTVYTTIGQVSTTNVPGADCYVDVNPVAFLGPAPAWTTAAGTTYSVMDQTSGTVITGDVYLGEFLTVNGSPLQVSPTAAKQHCIGHILFDSATAQAVTLENAERIGLAGAQFDHGLTITGVGEAVSFANYCPGAGQDTIFPAAVWQRLGFVNAAGGPISGTADGWGGLGFYASTLSVASGRSLISGAVTANRVTLDVIPGGFNNSLVCSTELYTCSIGVNAGLAVDVGGVTSASIRSTRLAGGILATENASIRLDRISWGARAGALNDTPQNAPLNLAAPLLDLRHSSSLHVDMGTRLEGGQTNDSLDNEVLRMQHNASAVWLGGHDVNLYTNQAWLRMLHNSYMYSEGNRVFAAKTLGAFPALEDIILSLGARLYSTGNWSKPVADDKPGRWIWLNQAEWIHGNIANDEGQLIAGDGNGGGIDCGPGPIILAEMGSKLVVGQPRLHNTNAITPLVLYIRTRSEVYLGTNNVLNQTYMLAPAGGGNALIVGIAAPIAGANPWVAASLPGVSGSYNDIPAVPSGSEELAYITTVA